VNAVNKLYDPLNPASQYGDGGAEKLRAELAAVKAQLAELAVSTHSQNQLRILIGEHLAPPPFLAFSAGSSGISLAAQAAKL
jgi:hypothetical protein